MTPNQTPQIVTLKDNRIAIVTPWHQAIIDECKRRMGEYKDLTLPAGVAKAWVMDASHRQAMKALIAELFPPREQLVERIYRFRTPDTRESTREPTIDGYKVVSFGRAVHSIARPPAGAPLEILEILEDTLSTGGTNTTPLLRGRLAVRVRCRREAVASWGMMGEVEIEEDPTPIVWQTLRCRTGQTLAINESIAGGSTPLTAYVVAEIHNGDGMLTVVCAERDNPSHILRLLIDLELPE